MADLVGRIPVRLIERPDGLDALPVIVDALLEDVGSLSQADRPETDSLETDSPETDRP